MLMSTLGDIERKTLNSEISSMSFEKIFLALSFIAGGGVGKYEDLFLRKKELVRRVLKKEYREEKKYFFPSEHEVIILRK